MNIQRKNSAHHFRMQSQREQTLIPGSDTSIRSRPDEDPRHTRLVPGINPLTGGFIEPFQLIL